MRQAFVGAHCRFAAERVVHTIRMSGRAASNIASSRKAQMSNSRSGTQPWKSCETWER
jgi:hypothetical protein